ncbi:MAG: type II toxin-antitoxin system VapC family toxin [Bdellovibrionaceae bacterium]|nr:type II toxin-antitoxin system VapC family toxin [Pseudobdellovibrionaceae bacterium]
MVRALLDTGVWLRRYHGLPLRRSLRDFLEREVTEYCLCPLSVAEVAFKWRRGRLPGIPDPAAWVEHSLENFTLVQVSERAARQAGLWDWEHGDLVDRILAALARESDMPLVHTDRVLKEFSGFPQRYYKGLTVQ